MTRSTVRPFDCLSDIIDALPLFANRHQTFLADRTALFIRYNGRAGESERVG